MLVTEVDKDRQDILDKFWIEYSESDLGLVKYPENIDEYLYIISNHKVSPKISKKYKLDTAEKKEKFISDCIDLYRTYDLPNLIINTDWDNVRAQIKIGKYFAQEIDIEIIDRWGDSNLPFFAYIWNRDKGYDSMFLFPEDMKIKRHDSTMMDKITASYYKDIKGGSARRKVWTAYLQIISRIPNKVEKR